MGNTMLIIEMKNKLVFQTFKSESKNRFLEVKLINFELVFLNLRKF